jgi:hypothetical protein
VPSPHLKTRGEDRNRLKRYEPSFPIPGLFPSSPCPHPENPRPGYLCGCRECVSRGDQIAIDKSEAPLPINPEDRALRKIDELKGQIGEMDPTDSKAIGHLYRQIVAQRAVIDEYSGVPTVYKPGKLKGGKGK